MKGTKYVLTKFLCSEKEKLNEKKVANQPFQKYI